MLNVTIDRKTWLQGEPEDSYLYRPEDEKMCCLGFAGLAAGLTKNQMCDVSSPKDLINEYNIKLPESLSKLVDYTKKVSGFSESYNYNSDIADNLMWENDDYICTGDDQTDFLQRKESRIIELGKKADIEFSFTGEYED